MRKEYIFVCAFYDSEWDGVITYTLIRKVTDLDAMIEYFDDWLEKFEDKFGDFKSALMFTDNGKSFIGVISTYYCEYTKERL